ncbi:efflux RND transporter periplasmic adaptor subunit [Maridesulfovibrio bastinii]|uniref:efflux RND transporter periplasmic adaptor subunit n=1 Tax=Maridesulfovibrio bastinii TaxID=47157 RepID=UPI000412956B|nr:efflux RND transporter periplasmic adaptor subunit [Maridesulfovibrio bastinii]
MTKVFISFLFSLFLLTSIPVGSAAEVTAHNYKPEKTVEAVKKIIPRWHEAVGTVQPKTDVRVEARVTGRVHKVLVRPGDRVSAGDPLIELDNRASEIRMQRARQNVDSAVSSVGQAREALSSAKARFSKTESTYRRMKALHDKNVVTTEELEQDETSYLQAKAMLAQAEDALDEAKSRLEEARKGAQEATIIAGYTTITAQEDGIIAKRKAEPGDLALPGKELLTLQTGGSLRLEAMIREGLISKVHIGDKLPVVISALGTQGNIEGIVEEIEPLADPVTRTFMAKARIPVEPGLYPGMFGRLYIPIEKTETVLIPEKAVIRVGQLETVMVKSGSDWQQIFIRTGRIYKGMVEVLSGLSGGEIIGIGGGPL